MSYINIKTPQQKICFSVKIHTVMTIEDVESERANNIVVYIEISGHLTEAMPLLNNFDY